MTTDYTLQRIPYTAASKREFLAFYKGRARPRRAVVFIHGHGGSGWQSLPWGAPLADAGFVVILPTLIGYDLDSQESSDYNGPRTIADLEAVVKQARQQLGIEALGVWGISRGAGAAALLASEQPQWFDAVVLQSGAYEFKSFYETTVPDISGKIEEEVIPLDTAAFKVRSSVEKIGVVKAPILVLHGTKDKRVPVNQAEQLRMALEVHKCNYRLELVEAGHFISGQTMRSVTLPFLQEHATGK